MCAKHLWQRLHDEHLEDLIQYVCYRNIKNPRGIYIYWCIIDYLRLNGFGKKAKLSAVPMARSISIHGEDENGTPVQDALFKDHAIRELIYDGDYVAGEIEEFLSEQGLGGDDLKWALNQYLKYLKETII